MSRDGVARVEDPWLALVREDTLPDLLDGFVENGHDLVVVIGAVGGAGTSLVASGLSLGRAVGGGAVALVELNLATPDLAGRWGVPSQRTLGDLEVVIGELSPRHVELVCHPHESGVYLLLAPPGGPVDGWDHGSTATLLTCCRSLGHVVVDAGAAWGPHVRAACDQATDVVIVTPPTLAGARRVRALLDVLGPSEPGQNRRVLANAGVGREHLSGRAFRSAVGPTSVATVPASPREADAIESGRWTPNRRGRLREAFEAAVGGPT